MGTSNPAMLSALAAARAARAANTDNATTLADVLTESRRAADNSQALRDALMGEPAPPEETAADEPQPDTEGAS